MVIKIDDKSIRDQIEKITEEDDNKGSIKFQQDVNGNWIVDEAVINDSDFESVRHLLLAHGQQIIFAGLPMP